VDYAIHSWEAIYDLNKATNSSTCAKSMYKKATAEIKIQWNHELTHRLVISQKLATKNV
jgi:hypothetical protein